MERKDIAPLTLITLPEGCSLFTPDIIIPAFNTFISKMLITLWRFQFDHFLNLSHPAFNFKLMSVFKLDNLIEDKSNFLLSESSPISGIPIVDFIQKCMKLTENTTVPSPFS